MLAEGQHLKDELTLLVDVGANAEIVFGNRARLIACSSPTGPAFEGARISCGQRAAPGAIERVRISTARRSSRAQGERLRSVVLDGAHVPFNLEAVLGDLASTTELSGPCVAIVALAADKDANGFVGELGKRHWTPGSLF